MCEWQSVEHSPAWSLRLQDVFLYIWTDGTSWRLELDGARQTVGLCSAMTTDQAKRYALFLAVEQTKRRLAQLEAAIVLKGDND